MNEEEFRELQKIIDEEKERCADPCQDTDDIWTICGLRESGYDYIPGLLEHIDAQAEQIATLKAALVQERLMALDRGLGNVAFRKSIAAYQLARELPEIFKEDT